MCLEPSSVVNGWGFFIDKKDNLSIVIFKTYTLPGVSTTCGRIA